MSGQAQVISLRNGDRLTVDQQTNGFYVDGPATAFIIRRGSVAADVKSVDLDSKYDFADGRAIKKETAVCAAALEIEISSTIPGVCAWIRRVTVSEAQTAEINALPSVIHALGSLIRELNDFSGRQLLPSGSFDKSHQQS